MRLRSILIALVWLTMVTSASAAPHATPWPRWQAHDASSTKTIDNTAYNAFLARYVVVDHDGPNGVRYGAVTAADIGRLGAYVAHLESLPIDDYSRNVQRAYWINLYNAETLYLVAVHWPVDSIHDIDSGLFDAGPWDEKRLTVEGVRLSLDDIEHRILRPIWPDGMVHYGLNCAAMSCPSLRARAYTGADVDQALADNARAYINSSQGVHLVHRRLIASRLYHWYAADFGGRADVLAHLRRFAGPSLTARLTGRDRIDRYTYDWRVNSAANVAATADTP
ncbi:DUF547 domain-containing protein [Salinisphaera sp. Q1T1-3]|uniref:DUF547 domain-containing protein n=1 Tax=Salinisphaera sp. Q1T1-3 TaxID=2321229 RepID=UPI0011C3634D|nr:DUF547 domain-containing protein [Salinisphaera sp. Q1T1-3]